MPVKIFFNILFWQLAAVTAICQTGYSKLIQVDEYARTNIDDIVYHKNEIYVRGNSYVDSLGLWGLFLAKLDTNGTVIWHKTICDTVNYYHIITNTPSRFFITPDNKWIIATKYYNLNQVLFLIVDSLGNAIAMNTYPHGHKTIFPLDVKYLYGHYYIFGSVAQINFVSDVFITKTDSLGNFIWTKYYGEIDLSDDFGDVLVNEDGTMTISSASYSREFENTSKLSGFIKPWLFTVDTAGTVVHQWLGEKFDNRTWGGGPFYKFDNGDFLVVSFDAKTVVIAPGGITEVHSSPTITRLDSNFNMIWKIDSLTGYTWIFDRFTDMAYDPVRDEFIVAGDLFVFYSGRAESEIWVMKFTPDGEILWNITDTITYNKPEIHKVAGVDVAPSGSIYVTGNIELPGKFYGWILKVTPDGCSDTLCTTTSILEQVQLKERKVLIYPNPATSEINVMVDDDAGSTEFRLIDAMGRNVMTELLLEKKTTLPISQLPGLYFYTASQNGKLIASGKLVVE